MTAAHSAMVLRIIAEERQALLEEAELHDVVERVYGVPEDAVEAARAARLRRVTEAAEAMRWARMRMRRGWAR